MKKIIGMVISVFAYCLLVCNIIYAQDYMSSDDAKQFLAFLYNDSKPDEIVKDGESDEFYQLLTGGYSSDIDKEQDAQMAFLLFVNSQVNSHIEKSEYAQKGLNEVLIKMATKKLDGSPNMAEEIINTTANDSLDAVKQSMFEVVKLGAKERSGVVDPDKLNGEDYLEIMEDSAKSWKEAQGIANKVNKFYEYSMAAIAGVWYVQNSEFNARYSYFSCYMNMLDNGSPGDVDFDIMADYNFYAILENNQSSIFVSFVPGKKAWYECRDVIERWATYTHTMKIDLKSKLPNVDVEIGTLETTTEETTETTTAERIVGRYDDNLCYVYDKGDNCLYLIGGGEMPNFEGNILLPWSAWYVSKYWYIGDYYTTKDYTVKYNTVISNSLEINGDLYLKSGKLQINRNGKLIVNNVVQTKSTFNCMGNVLIKGNYNADADSIFKIKEENAILECYGDFSIKNNNSIYDQSNGKMILHGDYYNNTDDYGVEIYFYTSKSVNIKTKTYELNGLYISDNKYVYLKCGKYYSIDYSGPNFIIPQNTNVTAETIAIYNKDHSYYVKTWRYFQNSGNLMILNDFKCDGYDLKHRLKIVNNGKIVVRGNFDIDNTVFNVNSELIVDKYAKAYAQSYLIIGYQGNMYVGEDLYIGINYDKDNTLEIISGGKLKINGNFYQDGGAYNSYTSTYPANSKCINKGEIIIMGSYLPTYYSSLTLSGNNSVMEVYGDFKRIQSGKYSNTVFSGGKLTVHGNYESAYDTTGTTIIISPAFESIIDLKTPKYNLEKLAIEQGKVIMTCETTDSNIKKLHFSTSADSIIKAQSISVKSGGYYDTIGTYFENEGRLVVNDSIKLDGYHAGATLTNNGFLTNNGDFDLTDSSNLIINGETIISGNLNCDLGSVEINDRLLIDSDFNLGLENSISSVTISQIGNLIVKADLNAYGGYYNGSYRYSSFKLLGNATIEGNYKTIGGCHIEMNDNSVLIINGNFDGICKTQYNSSYFNGGIIYCYGKYSNNQETYKTTVVFTSNNYHDISTPSFNIENIISDKDIIMYWDEDLKKVILIIPQECKALCNNIEINYVYNGTQVALENDGELMVNNNFKNLQKSSQSTGCIIHNGNTIVKKDFEDIAYSSKYNEGTLTVFGNYTNNSKLLNTVLIHHGAYEMGDINKDGFVDENDVSVILKHLTQFEIITDEISISRADVNFDEQVNLEDAIFLQTLINSKGAV